MNHSNYNQNSYQAPPQGTVPPQGYAPGQANVPPYGAPRPPYAPKMKWPPIAGDTFDTVFMIITLVFSVFAVHAVFFAGFFKLGFTVAYTVWFILENVYIFTKKKPKFSIYALLLGLLSLAAGGVFAFYNDESINTVLLIFMAFANAEYFMLMSEQNRFPAGEISSVLDAARMVVVIPFEFLSEPFKSAFSASKAPGQKKGKAKNTVQVLIGLAIAIPIAAVLIGLLANADAAFKGLIGKIFSNILLSLVKLILGVLIFPLLLSPAFALRYRIPNRGVQQRVPKNHKKFPAAISITVLSVIVLVYLIYLFAQLAYFFDGFSGILPENYSASAYARRGFFEMCAICSINALLIALSMAFARSDSKGSEVLHKLFQIFISLVSLVIATSAFSKMYLYIKLFGFTRKRVLTSIFILMLCIVFLALILRILIRKFPYMKMIAVCCFAVMIVVGYADIDSHIARYNYELYQNKPTIAAHLEQDAGFMDELGDSAAEFVSRFAEEGKGDVKDKAQSWLCEMWGRENIKDFYSANLSKSNTLLSFNKARIESTRIFDAYNKRYDFKHFFKDYNENGYPYEYEESGKLPKEFNQYCYDYTWKHMSD